MVKWSNQASSVNHKNEVFVNNLKDERPNSVYNRILFITIINITIFYYNLLLYIITIFNIATINITIFFLLLTVLTFLTGPQWKQSFLLVLCIFSFWLYSLFAGLYIICIALTCTTTFTNFWYLIMYLFFQMARYNLLTYLQKL